MSEPDEESQEGSAARMDREIQAVIDIMKQEWPGCVDYHMREDEMTEILDAGGNVIATIDGQRLDQFWNLSEGALLIQINGKTLTVFTEQ